MHMEIESGHTSSEFTFPNDPPRPMSSLCSHSPVSVDRRKKNASSRNVMVHVTAKCAPLGWKSICRISPGTLNDLTADEGSGDELRSICQGSLVISQTTTTGPSTALLQPETKIFGSTGENARAAIVSVAAPDRIDIRTDVAVVRA